MSIDECIQAYADIAPEIFGSEHDTGAVAIGKTRLIICVESICNPAPLNGSAPNLVVVENDKAGKPHFKRAFNTQVCT